MLKLKDKSVLLHILLLLFYPVIASTEIHFNSGTQQNTLIELFTSQSCSSCPPAEQWMTNLSQHPQLWTKIIPVAFHVDYWNQLGWQDPFSSPRYSARQRNYKRTNHVQSVYTPGFVVNGQEWRGWFSKQAIPFAKQEAGILSGTLSKNQLQVSYSQKEKPLSLYIVLLGSNLKTKVLRGENRNRELRQDFVALNYKSYNSTNGKWKVTIDLNDIDPNQSTQHQIHERALALWVTYTNTLTPLQATGGWLKTIP